MRIAAALRGLLAEKFLRAGALLFVAIAFTHLFNYLFQIVMARQLAPADYGALNAALAFVGLLGLPLVPLNMIQTRAVAAAADEATAAANFRHYFRLYALLAAAAAGLGALAAGPVAAYLKFPDAGTAFLLLLVFAAGLFGNSATSLLSGRQSFGRLGAWYAAQGGLRLAACAVAVALAPGLGAVVLGLLAATALAALAGNLAVRRLWALPAGPTATPPRLAGSELLHVSLANAGFFALTQADILLVNASFAARDAGLYAAAAVIGKAVLHLPAVIVLALFPAVSATSARGEDARHLLVKALGVTVLLAGLAAAALSLFTDWVVLTFFGSKYAETIPLLRWFGWVMLPMAMVQVLKNYFIARERPFFSYLLFAAALVEIAWISFAAPSLAGVLMLLAVLATATLLAGLAVPLLDPLRRPKSS